MQKLKSTNLVAQANSIIEGRYTTTKNEQTLLFAMISLIDPKDEEFPIFSVTLDELATILKINRTSAVREFKKISRRLLKRIIEINSPNGDWEAFQWVSRANVKQGRVNLKFHDDLKPYLLALKKTGNFTQHRLWITVNLRSVYTIRIYQLLKEYDSKRMSHFEFSVSDFKKMMLGEDSKNYPLYKNFRNRVLDPAKKELKEKDPTTGLYKVDLSFDLETRRTGRSISHLIFIINQQNTAPTPEETNIVSTINQADPEIIATMTALGITQTKATDIAQHYETSYILNKLHILEEKQQQKPIKNPAGFLIKALQNNWKSEADTKKTIEKKAKHKAEKKALKAAQEQQQKEAFIQERTEKVSHFLDALSYGKSIVIMRQFEASDGFKQIIEKDLLLNNLYQSTGIDDDEIRHHFNTFIISTHLDPSLNDFQAWQAQAVPKKT